MKFFLLIIVFILTGFANAQTRLPAGKKGTLKTISGETQARYFSSIGNDINGDIVDLFTIVMNGQRNKFYYNKKDQYYYSHFWYRPGLFPWSDADIHYYGNRLCIFINVTSNRYDYVYIPFPGIPKLSITKKGYLDEASNRVQRRR